MNAGSKAEILFRYPSEKTGFSEALSACLLQESMLIFVNNGSKCACLLILVIVFANELFCQI
jgi:hypothetical protein